MENALLISLSRQMALQRRMDVLANNMANVNTAGFKSDSVMFEEYMMPVARMNDVNGSQARLSYVQDVAASCEFYGADPSPFLEGASRQVPAFRTGRTAASQPGGRGRRSLRAGGDKDGRIPPGVQ